MKKLIPAVAITAVMGGIVYYGDELANQFNTVSVETHTVVEEKKVEVDIIQEAIDAELDARREDIEQKAQSAYDDTYAMEVKKVELEVRQQLQAEQEAIITDLEKEVGVYWKSKSNIVRLIKEYFPEEPHTALAVAECESGLNPNAHNPHNNDGTTDGGLWQINDVHNARLEALGLDKYDPEDATKFARMLYEERGFRDWVCWWSPHHLAMAQ